MVLVEVGFLIKSLCIMLGVMLKSLRTFLTGLNTLQGFLGQDCQERQGDIRKKDGERHQDMITLFFRGKQFVSTHTSDFFSEMDHFAAYLYS